MLDFEWTLSCNLKARSMNIKEMKKNFGNFCNLNMVFEWPTPKPLHCHLNNPKVKLCHKIPFHQTNSATQYVNPKTLTCSMRKINQKNRLNFWNRFGSMSFIHVNVISRFEYGEIPKRLFWCKTNIFSLNCK